MKSKLLLFLFCATFLSSAIFAQNRLYVAHWNLENLYDTENDPNKDDEEFLPTGKMKWDDQKLATKFFRISQVVNDMNDKKGPDILSVCEIENKAVLATMTAYDQFLKKHNYGIAHMDSPDMRGVDVGILYKKDLFNCLSVEGDTVHLPDNHPTRLVLLATLVYKQTGDTLFVFSNHWPSRRGGEEQSEKNREAAASTLKAHVNKILLRNKNANIIITGDFNDEPTNKSITNTLGANPYFCKKDKVEPSKLYNLAWEKDSKDEGSYCFKDEWNMIDQMIVSTNLIEGSKIFYECGSYNTFVTEYNVYQTGDKEGQPIRTYEGKNYIGGYSDHLPIFAIFDVK